MSNIIEILEERGFIDQITDKELKKIIQKPVNFYVGFDPTADSLHVGHLVSIMALSWLEKYGHKPYALVGGATGRIGDPSCKSIERPFLDDKIISDYIDAISVFLKKILTKSVIVNNNDWYKDIGFVDFLRDIGKHFRIGPMLSKESVKLRMQSEEGLSFTEFSYQVLQAYDFYYLNKHHNICLQMGGSDQWGNIVAGIDLVRKLSQKTVYGITFPLLTKSDGSKFGKSESGAIWLNKDKMSEYQFYQYFVRIPDSDVIKLLKMLTFLDIKEINDIEKQMHSSSYVPNTAQKKLAEEVTKFVHGEKGLQTALRVTKGAAPGTDTKLDAEVLKNIAKDMPNANLKHKDVVDIKYTDLCVKIGLTASKSEAVRLIKNQGAYLNNQKITDPSYLVSEQDLIDGSFVLFGSGKKKKILISIS